MKSKLIFSLVFVSIFTTAIFAQNNSQKPEPIPNWLSTIIEKGKIGKSPITDIKSYVFNEKLVYLVNYDAGCCDHFSAILYDNEGNKICSPFGGITGRGDLQCVDFMANRLEEKFLWQNPQIKLQAEENDKLVKSVIENQKKAKN